MDSRKVNSLFHGSVVFVPSVPGGHECAAHPTVFVLFHTTCVQWPAPWKVVALYWAGCDRNYFVDTTDGIDEKRKRVRVRVERERGMGCRRKEGEGRGVIG